MVYLVVCVVAFFVLMFVRDPPSVRVVQRRFRRDLPALWEV